MSNDRTPPERSACAPEWAIRPLSHLVAHLCDRYRCSTQQRIAAISELLLLQPWLEEQEASVAADYIHLLDVFTRLGDKVESHMLLEDNVLLPLVVACEHPDVVSIRPTPEEICRLVARVMDEHRQICGLIDDLRHAIAPLLPTSSSHTHRTVLLIGNMTTLALLLKGQMALEDGSLWPRTLELLECRSC